MENKSIFYGVIGLVVGVLLTGFVIGGENKEMKNSKMETSTKNTQMNSGSMMSGEDMMNQLKGKTGEEFDKAFLSQMIVHHESAIKMATEAKMKAKRDEIKNLANDIISAQEKEISQMKEWQKMWGY